MCGEGEVRVREGGGDGREGGVCVWERRGGRRRGGGRGGGGVVVVVVVVVGLVGGGVVGWRGRRRRRREEWKTGHHFRGFSKTQTSKDR